MCTIQFKLWVTLSVILSKRVNEHHLSLEKYDEHSIFAYAFFFRKACHFKLDEEWPTFYFKVLSKDYFCVLLCLILLCMHILPFYPNINLGA